METKTYIVIGCGRVVFESDDLSKVETFVEEYGGYVYEFHS
jgi:hypothetical protein